MNKLVQNPLPKIIKDDSVNISDDKNDDLIMNYSNTSPMPNIMTNQSDQG